MDVYDYYVKEKKHRKFTMKMMADDLGCSIGHFMKIFHGRACPSAKLGLKIQEYTKGEVTFVEMVNFYLGCRKLQKIIDNINEKEIDDEHE